MRMMWECARPFRTTKNRGGFPGGSEGRASACNAGDPGLIPGLGRSLGERNGNLFHYSCLGNPTDRGAWQATVCGGAEELYMTWKLNNKYKSDLHRLWNSGAKF